jgi:hypothetical protein
VDGKGLWVWLLVMFSWRGGVVLGLRVAEVLTVVRMMGRGSGVVGSLKEV